MSLRASLPAFTPTAVPAAELAARTVGREEIVARIVASLRSAATSGDRPHILVVGPRGSGKTHLLHVVVHEAGLDLRVAERLAVVALPEDAPDIVSYVDLLYAVVERLIEPSQEHAMTLLAGALEARRDAARLEEMILRLLDGRVLVLVLENLDRIFRDFGEQDQSRLRAFTETSRQVMLLASAPLLVESLADHGQPWYGAFDLEQLADLTAAEGAELLRRFALEAEDDDLAAFLDTAQGRGRLEAVAHLTGGSPRMWTVLAGCLTIELLDELVPLVEALLDELVPYYQERLNSLSPNERKLVVELCRPERTIEDGNLVTRPRGIFSVAELAERCGLDRNVATTSLNRLYGQRWVRRCKPPGSDRRSTWYEIREPMLRHHLQHRDSRGETLHVTVSFLREWYSPLERRRYFAAAKPESLAERYLHSIVLADLPPANDRLYEEVDLEDLLVDARLFLGADGSLNAKRVRSHLAGVVAEAAVLTVQEGREAAERAMRVRIENAVPDSRGWAESAVAAIDAADEGGDSEEDEEVRGQELVAAGLRAGWLAVGDGVDRPNAIALGLLAAGWRGACGHEGEALVDLEALAPEAAELDDWRLRLAVDGELAYFAWEDGQRERALAVGTRVLEEREERLGTSHLDTLTSYVTVADWYGDLGEYQRAADLYEKAVVSYATMDPESVWALHARYRHALYRGFAGESQLAVDLLVELVATNEQILGTDDWRTLVSRGGLAYFLLQVGRPEEARDILAALVEDHARVFGEDEDLLSFRYQHAQATAETGDHVQAAELLEKLIPDLARAKGADDLQTLSSRAWHAVEVGLRGQSELARELYVDLVADYERVLGPDNDATLVAKQNLAHATSLVGDRVEAIMLVGDVVRVRLAGGEEEDATLRVRGQLASLTKEIPFEAWNGESDDPLCRALRTAVEIDPFAVLVGWCKRTLELPSEQREEAVRLITAMAGDADVLQSLDAVVLAVAGGLSEQSLDAQIGWLDMWAAALSEAELTEVGYRVLLAVGASLQDDDAPMLMLPAEERQVAETVIEELKGASA